MSWLRNKTEDTPLRPPNPALDEATLRQAQELIDEVRRDGEEALQRLGRRFGDLQAGDPLIYTREDLQAALDRVDPTTRRTLENAARRIRDFADRQRGAIQDFSQVIPGGRTGLRYRPVARARATGRYRSPVRPPGMT